MRVNTRSIYSTSSTFFNLCTLYLCTYQVGCSYRRRRRQSPTVKTSVANGISPGLRVNTRYIHSTRWTSFSFCTLYLRACQMRWNYRRRLRSLFLCLFYVNNDVNEVRIVGFWSEAAKFALCEAKLHEGPCIQCCDSTFSGLFGFAERPACHAACKILPAPPAKRQLWIGGKICLNCRSCCNVH